MGGSEFKPKQLECENANNVDNFNFFIGCYGKGSKCYERNTGSGRCYRAQYKKDQAHYVKVRIRETRIDYLQMTIKK